MHEKLTHAKMQKERQIYNALAKDSPKTSSKLKQRRLKKSFM
jgi:hypothetical protein